MKMILLWTGLFVLCLKGKAQWSAGAEQYYSAIENQSFNMVQVEWYQTNKWYVESRHNYEALNSFSFYVGRVYEKKAAFSYVVCPMAAIVWGGLSGGAAGIDADFSYKKFSYSLQAQYTFSLSDRSQDYIYSWSEFGYQLLRKMNVGILIQQIKPYCLKTSIKNGLYVNLQFGNLVFPLYVFDLASNARSMVLGISFQRDENKKHKSDLRL